MVFSWKENAREAEVARRKLLSPQGGLRLRPVCCSRLQCERLGRGTAARHALLPGSPALQAGEHAGFHLKLV